MAERTFFNIRYAFPGFMFVFGFILFSPKLLSIKLDPNTLSVYDLSIGVVSIVGVSLLGILSSQLWHNVFNYCLRKYMDGELFDHITKLKFLSKYDGLYYRIQKKSIKESLDYIAILDYILFYLFMKKSKISKYEADFIRGYLSRRWDLFNVLGSGIFSYILGLFFGAWSDYLVFEYTNINLNFFEYYKIVKVFSMFILFLMILSLNWINKDRHGMIKAVLNNMTISKEDLKKPFDSLEFDVVPK